ncbi:putative adp-ribosylation factor gtpase-activating protein agd13 [Quercus suber]|uniref:Adp-ribosylation factor gtpase-activating protein agd13 n=1 Tax=Quercus suber TaxID=58331 RepID=A0AAW0IQP8_QUESU
MTNKSLDFGKPASVYARRLYNSRVVAHTIAVFDDLKKFLNDQVSVTHPQNAKRRSANIGVFICLKCCGVHKSLGTHISKVLSVTLDEWSDDEIESMVEVGGNSSANAIYEAFVPGGYEKPGPDASHELHAKFIRAKYELQEFLKPSLRIVSLPSEKGSLKSSFCRKLMDSFRSNSSHNSEGMVEFIGLLKVKVIKGTNLAIRDMMTSDPYVILTLGQQTVQTTIIKSNLNPVWNEELMLSVPQQFGPLKLVSLSIPCSS